MATNHRWPFTRAGDALLAILLIMMALIFAGLAFSMETENVANTIPKNDTQVDTMPASVSHAQVGEELCRVAGLAYDANFTLPAGCSPDGPPAKIPSAGPTRNGTPARREIFIVTAYCPCKLCCGPNAQGITASGIRAAHPCVAAPAALPFGARLNIPGYGVATVQDRGGAIRGNKLDVYFPTHAEALRWGRRILTVEVLP